MQNKFTSTIFLQVMPRKYITVRKKVKEILNELIDTQRYSYIQLNTVINKALVYYDFLRKKLSMNTREIVILFVHLELQINLRELIKTVKIAYRRAKVNTGKIVRALSYFDRDPPKKRTLNLLIKFNRDYLQKKYPNASFLRLAQELLEEYYDNLMGCSPKTIAGVITYILVRLFFKDIKVEDVADYYKIQKYTLSRYYSEFNKVFLKRGSVRSLFFSLLERRKCLSPLEKGEKRQ